MKCLTKTKRWLQRGSPTILTVLGAVGVVATAVITAKETPKALKLLKASESEKGEELTTFEKIQVTAPAYIPTFIIGVSTIACIFGANVLNKKQQAMLTSAYALVNQSYQEYKNKLKELYGEETHQKIVDSIVKENVKPVSISCPGICGSSSLDFDDEEDYEEKRLFYDAFSKRYFESTVEKVIQAEYHLNRNFTLGADTTVNMFYEFLGLDPVDYGDSVGWGFSYGYSWIDFHHHKTELDDGLQCYIIEMVFEPDSSFRDY